ncbi:WD40 repeat-like protein [Basidiobolus meristosporus CBS 931.73]|uniref:WD40 repeat-like protein n=1 Tax=Basidiobolus meristosporus CBS 931.73 TaxID=1314790 RepID=A0A1Y1YRQ1_9FUNG|nr:WD40 repeat-like protein [Basidiobolus meristosporus CBS 931.73]|eukprot:ORY00710.1 WD40 repeat-like protein [Basidiobolus meristosporus CBS 931.73]
MAPTTPARSSRKLVEKKTPNTTKSKLSKVVDPSDLTVEEIPSLTEQSLTLNKVSGGCLSNYPLVFTKDSKFFFCAASNVIKIYSVETGEVVRVLQGHTKEITSLFLNPTNSLQLYTGSLDGTIRLWDFNDAVLLKTFEVGIPITHMVTSEHAADYMYVVATKESKSYTDQLRATSGSSKVKKNSVVFRYSFKGSMRTRLVKLFKTWRCNSIKISPNGEYLAVAGRSRLIVWKIHETEFSAPMRYKSDFLLTCIAFHPTEPCIATGDERGRIVLWYCLSEDTMERPVTSVMHWHAHKVNHIAFTDDGVYMVSGGEEAVLVVWQLQTGHRQFLPRLGSEIKSIVISPDQSLYAVGHLDNSVRIVSAVDLSIKQAIQGLKYAQMNHTSNPLRTGLIVEPKNNHIVLNGVPGTIQFYNPYTDRHVMELEVSPRNRVSRTDEKEIIEPQVEHVAFSKNGDWMATVDSRDDGENTPELYLKFWKFDPNTQSYTMNTRVDFPHQGRITSLQFHPSIRSPMVVTAGSDKKFKVWELQTPVDRRADVSWVCRSVGFYRDSTPYNATFSEDGSILAVSYGHIITLWDPYTNTIQGLLSHSPHTRPIKKLVFTSNSPFLIAITKDHLYVWNLLSCTIWWSCRLVVTKFAVDQSSSQFAVAVANQYNTTSLVVFEPSQPIPVLIHEIPDTVKSLSFFPKHASDTTESKLASNLMLLNGKCDLHILSHTNIAPVKEQAKGSLSSTVTNKSYFSDIFGARKPAETTKQVDEPQRKVQKSKSATKTLLNAPSHVIPPVSSLYEFYMDKMLSRIDLEHEETPEIENSEEKESESEEEDTMEIDSEVAPVAEQREIKAESINNAETEFDYLADFFKIQLQTPKKVTPAPVATPAVSKVVDSSKLNGTPNGKSVKSTRAKSAATPKPSVPSTPSKTPARSKTSKTPGKTPGRATRTPRR